MPDSHLEAGRQVSPRATAAVADRGDRTDSTDRWAWTSGCEGVALGSVRRRKSGVGRPRGEGWITIRAVGDDAARIACPPADLPSIIEGEGRVAKRALMELDRLLRVA